MVQWRVAPETKPESTRKSEFQDLNSTNKKVKILVKNSKISSLAYWRIELFSKNRKNI